MAINIIKTIICEIGAFYSSINCDMALYPFPYPEKALTFDWDNIGTDFSQSISKYRRAANDTNI